MGISPVTRVWLGFCLETTQHTLLVLGYTGKYGSTSPTLSNTPCSTLRALRFRRSLERTYVYCFLWCSSFTTGSVRSPMIDGLNGLCHSGSLRSTALIDQLECPRRPSSFTTQYCVRSTPYYTCASSIYLERGRIAVIDAWQGQATAASALV